MSGERRQPEPLTPVSAHAEPTLPVAWLEFIRFCRDLRHGEIERVFIQDGVPVLAEVTRKKVRFGREG